MPLPGQVSLVKQVLISRWGAKMNLNIVTQTYFAKHISLTVWLRFFLLGMAAVSNFLLQGVFIATYEYDYNVHLVSLLCLLSVRIWQRVIPMENGHHKYHSVVKCRVSLTFSSGLCLLARHGFLQERKTSRQFSKSLRLTLSHTILQNK